ncbi:unnamed protein product [Miscanthus lutarioriparius]|uniref:CCT domain-containing protein n=1 Tax=Miscanthus lutarioriparius TaxID=422564 RepID=A0A811QSB1_9POAL|nr:unnamed protein product [Miscanthus lutarioriparius]
MYQQHHHWANSTCYCVDGELKAGDAILSSRPDALLADGGAFLPSPLLPTPSSYMPHHYSQQAPAIVPPPMDSRLHAITHLSQASSSDMAAATSSSTFRRALSTGDLIVRDREEEQRVPVAARKTLADSRPRVKGRFARNGGDYTETEADAVADHHVHVPAAAHQSESESDSPAATAAAPEWWPAVQEEGINLAELCADDDEMMAAYLGVSSISIADHHYSCHP